MAQTFALQSLLDVATSETDSAAASLGKLNHHVQLQEQKLALLLKYRTDYLDRFRRAVENGLDGAGLRNFNEFMERLEHAVHQQQAVVDEARQHADRGRHHWQLKRRKSNAFDTLSQRFTATAQRREANREQKAQDDFASRIACRKPAMGQ